MITRVLTSVLTLLAAGAAAQSPITITASDLPVPGDTLRWSTAASAASGINLTQTGANQTWNFSGMTAIAQGIDEYKYAAQVNPTFTIISPTAYGYKVADSFPGASQLGAGITVSNIYTFFNKKPAASPNRFVAEGFAATVATLPTPAAYDREDTLYRLPLSYGSSLNSSFYLKANVSIIGGLRMGGTRMTTVDGWGTIQTPYTTSPVACIRVRSEINELDTITVGSTTYPVIARNTVEYRWLAQGEHYPLLFVTTNKSISGSETITSVRYRDTKRTGLLAVGATPRVRELTVYPNPASGSDVTLQLPATWADYAVTALDAQGRRIYETANQAVLPVRSWPAGVYFIQVQHGAETGLVRLVK